MLTGFIVHVLRDMLTDFIILRDMLTGLVVLRDMLTGFIVLRDMLTGFMRVYTTDRSLYKGLIRFDLVRSSAPVYTVLTHGDEMVP